VTYLPVVLNNPLEFSRRDIIPYDAVHAWEKQWPLFALVLILFRKNVVSIGMLHRPKSMCKFIVRVVPGT